MINYKFADGGSPETEKNDCSVRALAIVTWVGYKKAYKWLEKFGRKPSGYSKGINTNRAYRNCKFRGYSIKPVFQAYQDEKQHSLGWFLKHYKFPPRCIVRVPGHVFALVNGTVRDMEPPRLRKRVVTIWEVAKPKVKR